MKLFGVTVGTFKWAQPSEMPSLFRRGPGLAFASGVLGGFLDRAAQGVTEAALSYAIPHYDALPLLGKEQSMRRYPDETWIEYRDRLFDAWDLWDYAGDERSIVDNLAAAGLPGANVFRFSETGSWSEFVVIFDDGSHPVTGTQSYGDAGLQYGSAEPYGPNNITPEQLSARRDAIIDWKPARWRCPWMIFAIDSKTYGTGHTYGEAGLVYSGSQVRTAVQY